CGRLTQCHWCVICQAKLCGGCAENFLEDTAEERDGVDAELAAWRWLTVLVALNLTLLAAVGVLVLELTSTPELTAEYVAESPVAQERTEPAAPRVPTPPPAKPTAVAPPPPVAPSPPVPVATSSPTEAAPAPVERSAASKAEKKAEAKAEKKERVKAEKRRVRLTVQTSPPRAAVRIKGHGTGSAPRRIDALVGARLTVKVSAPGHQPKQVPVVLTADRTLKVTLSPVQMGTLSFRYFPASATVRVDGKTVSTAGSNRVQVSLPVGQHRLVLTDGERRHAKAFEIRPDRTTNLATITLGP
ncbi:MAG: PEGA domain-containing protein, partial [Myxococcota bacterium]|nr:PEGA domain-containing protein [Myxococcota bacterium]